MRGFPVCPASCIFIGKERKAVKMNGATITAIVLIAAILFFAVRYIYKEKKEGKTCIGCPYADSCPKRRQNLNCIGRVSQKREEIHK